jgi:hypothetical protein
MANQSRFLFATMMSAAAFVMAGGLHATAQAVRAEEGQAASGAPQETSIPFVNMGGIRDWQAVDDDTLYVQDIGRKWYVAKLNGACTDLTFATSIGFETKGVNQLDRFGTVIVGNQRCAMGSFVASGPPPAKKK